MSFWQTGATRADAIPQATTTYAHSGAASVLLGNPTYNCNGGAFRGDSYVAQTIALPSGVQPTLTFSFRMFTQDATTTKIPTDQFAVFINNLDNSADILFSFANKDTTKSSCGPGGPNDFGWQTVSVTLNSVYEGQTITLYFVNQLLFDDNFNTWTYVDDVSITFP